MIAKNQKGMALGLVIIVMAVLSFLGVALLSLSVASAKSTAYQDKSKQAYYLARSGADAVSTHLIQNPQDDDILLSIKNSDENYHFTNGTFKVNVTGGNNLINVTGTGNVSNVQKSTTAVIAKLTVGEMIDKAIYTNSNLDITGMSVEGDIQSGGNINYKSNGSHAFKGSALANSYKYIETVLPPALPQYVTQDLVVSGAVEINTSAQLNSITINNNKTLKIVANNKVVNIVVNEIIGKGNIDIVATGNGRVNLFVKDLMDIQTKGNINNDDPNKLYIYMQEGSTFKMQANIKVFAYIIAPQAAAIVQSNQSTIYGALFADNLTKNGSNGANGAVIFIPTNNSDEYDENLKAYKIFKWEE